MNRAVERRQGAGLCFERGAPSRPIVLGLLRIERETPLLDALLQPESSEVAQAELPELIANGKQHVSLAGLLDGSTDEFELRCGKASLVFRRNGQAREARWLRVRLN